MCVYGFVCVSAVNTASFMKPLLNTKFDSPWYVCPYVSLCLGTLLCVLAHVRACVAQKKVTVLQVVQAHACVCACGKGYVQGSGAILTFPDLSPI